MFKYVQNKYDDIMAYFVYNYVDYKYWLNLGETLQVISQLQLDISSNKSPLLIVWNWTVKQG